MRIVKVVLIACALLAVTGCACRTKKVGPAEAQANVPVAREGVELADINFAFDRYDLSEAAKRILNTNAQWLKANPDARVQIEGHCDERGTNEYNMVLGANRARAAYDYLRSLGISESRMSTVSYGEELPLDPGHNEAAWAKNRRAHFNVLK
jgi:peptidoglycan-associated lipoprotein